MGQALQSVVRIYKSHAVKLADPLFDLLGPLEVRVVLDIIGVEGLEAVARIILLLVEEIIEGLHGVIR